MTSESNVLPSPLEGEEEEEFWSRWHTNTYSPALVKRMKTPLTAPLDLAISDSDVAKLKAGFRPQSQDDKWAWLVEHGHGSGDDTLIHVIRHFVKEEVYVLHITQKSRKEDGASARVYGITWEGEWSGVRDDVEQAKRNVVVLARSILGCEFETLPHCAPGTV
jgi:hypothetical protein